MKYWKVLWNSADHLEACVNFESGLRTKSGEFDIIGYQSFLSVLHSAFEH